MKINDITLQEGYMLRLERDYNADMLVLHVKDTKTGRRSEVRGKLGYETDGYDDNDPLHQLLDKVGRSASVSDMMNGDVVHINPKHPQGPNAEKAANKVTSESQLNELFDRPYALSWQTQGALSAARFQTDNGHEYMVRFEPMSKDSENYETSFSMRNEHGDNEVKRTGMGDEYRVFSSVISAIKQFMDEHREVESIQFDAHREGEARTSKDIKDSRIELYKKLVKKFATANNFEYADQSIARMHKFMLRRPNETVSESTKDEILQRIRKKQYQDFIESMLESIHKLVQKHGDRHSIGHYAFEIGRVYGLDGRKIEKMYKDKYEIKENINESEEYKIPITSEMQQLNKLFTKNKFEIRIVGGAVRDVVLNKAPKDIDLATDATPVEMQKMFDSAGIKHIPSGIEHGTITAIINSEEFEITTLRSDAETDGRHATVEFVRSWEQDALRRDLTYNAMSMDFDGNLFDYHNGMDDLQNKVSRFVGDPAERIQEDYLRILRYFRFQGRLDNPKFEKETLQAIKANATGLTKVSVERVWMEMGKILSGNNIAKILTAMSSTGILKTIGLSNKNISAMVDGDYELVNLARLGDASIGKRWKLSNVDNNILKFLVEHANSPIDKKILSDMIVDGTPKILLYRWAQMLGKYEIFANHIKSFEAPVFPVNGNDLIQAGFKKGPDLGKKLNLLKQKWKQSGYKSTKDQLLGESTQKIDEKLKSKKYKKSYKAAKASGRRRRKKLRDDVTESLDSAFPYTITHCSEFHFEGITFPSLTVPALIVEITDSDEDGNWEIEFRVNNSVHTTGGGRAHQIFATVIAIIKDWWSICQRYRPDYWGKVKSIEFSASKENAGGRERLYQRFGKQFAAAIGFRLTKKSIWDGSATNFLLVNPKEKDEPGYEPVPENFADGKKKGKSRPGRRRRKKLRDDVTESLDSVLPYTITHSSEFNFEGKSAVRGAPTLLVSINDFHEDGNWEIEFRVGDSTSTTGGGRAHQIFATVIAIIKDWWKDYSNFTYYPVKSIEFSASKENAGGRERLYQRFGKQFAAAIGFRLTKKSIHAGSTTNFLLVNPKEKDEPGYELVPESNVQESMNNPYPYTWELEQEDYQVAVAPLPNDSGLDVTFDNTDNNWFIDFSVDFSQDKTGAGDEFRIFATVVAVIKDWWKNKFDKKADSIVWSGSKKEEEGNSRVKLYKRFAQQMASQTGWKLSITDGGSADLFKLSNPNPTPRDDKSDNTVEENFKDGKVKGKSRPGRVKRSGASCNGSVTALRKRAKNASGEKARMYHWCANMKSGKK